MRVLFLEDVANVGRAGEVKEVSDGFGRNYLLPRGLAVLATSAALKQHEAELQVQAKREARLGSHAEELAQHLSQTPVAILVRVGSRGRLFGSVTSSHIAQELQRLTGHPIDKRNIRLDEPIKQLGTFQVPIRLAKDVSTVVTVVVQGLGLVAEPEVETPQELQPGPGAEDQAFLEEVETSEPSD